MMGHKYNCLSNGHKVWKMLRTNISRNFYIFSTNIYTMTKKNYMNWKLNIICSWWLFYEATTNESSVGLFEWLGLWHFCYKQLGGHMNFVSTSSDIFCNIII